MSDEPSTPDDEYGETEVFVREGEAWFANAFALAKRLKIESLTLLDGTVYACVSGKGEVKLGDLLAAEGKADIRPIK